MNRAARLALVPSIAIALTAMTATSAAAHPMTFIAHRGATADAPESTIPAFLAAASQGIEGVEFDIAFTSGGAPVIMHDPTVDRTTDCTGLVTSFSWAALSACDAGSWFSPDYTGTRVPSFRETLTALAPTNIKMYVHLRTVTSGQATAIMNRVDDSGIPQSRFVFFSDNATSLANIKAAGADVTGRIFYYNSPYAKGWGAPEPVLLAYDTSVSTELVNTARAAGKTVVAIETPGISYLDAMVAGVDEFMANDL